MMLYGVLMGLHVRELVWYRDVDLQSTVYDILEASIFYTRLSVIFWPPFPVHVIRVYGLDKQIVSDDGCAVYGC